ncbi:MAG: tail fiber domain-containing protein [Bacteroidales bacterium]|nr:tail fiber domain-containing protein [Bacteroidales bacterium]
MKTKFLNTIGILAIALSAGTASAQTLPNSFNYQAVITAEDGSPVSNHDITVEVSIKQGTNCEDGSCPTLWQELHAPKTNEFGSFSIEIGDNNAINTTAGSLSKYSDIDWLDTKNGFYYLQVRVDFGEATYLNGMTDLGTTKFSAVPYSLAAQTADFANSIATDDKGNIANKLGQLADVTITTPKANQILVYDATINSWKNTDPATAQGLTNINISSPKTGDYLVYNEANGKWENKTIATPKLGDLADVKNMTTVNGGEILYYNGTDKIWENKALKLNTVQDINVSGAKDGDVLTYNGTFWIPQEAKTGETVTKLSQLTDDVTITSPADGQTLQYQGGKWINAATAASDTWLTDNNKTFAYTTYKYIGIGTGTDKPSSLLHIKDGTKSTLFNARCITIGSSTDRIKSNGSIALADGSDVNGVAVIAGNGSKSGQYSKNSIIMGDGAEGVAECDIVIGNNSVAKFAHSAVFGNNLTTNTANQFIFGRYNEISDAKFIVANGKVNGTTTIPKNIFTIDEEGNVNATEFSSSSDMRLKTNINTMTGALDNVLKLRGVTFNWKESSNARLQYGFIAQEMEKVFPDLVGTDSNGFKTINYSGVIPVLTEAIKTQQEEIESLKSENEQLKSTLEQLLKRVEALENR